MASLVLRPAFTADMARVADIWHAAWHTAHPGHVPNGLTAARTLDAFRDRTPARVSDTTVAVLDDEVVGFIMIDRDEVEQVFVDPTRHGSGVASLLLDEAERQVAAGGYDVAWLAVAIGNARARAFYEKRGWSDDDDLPYQVVADGTTYISPCRRYVKPLS